MKGNTVDSITFFLYEFEVRGLTFTLQSVITLVSWNCVKVAAFSVKVTAFSVKLTVTTLTHWNWKPKCVKVTVIKLLCQSDSL